MDMPDGSYFIELDKKLICLLNYDGGVFFDNLWLAFSSRLIWIPLALVFLYACLSRSRNWRVAVLLVIGVALTVALCDQISSSIIKPMVMRLRPSRTPELCEMLHYVNDYHGGKFGFVSSHAANAFGVFAFVSLIVRRRVVTYTLLAFTLCVCYSRIYLGVHFLGDIICGGLLGLLVGWYVFKMLVIVYHPLPKYGREIFSVRSVINIPSAIALTVLIAIGFGIVGLI